MTRFTEIVRIRYECWKELIGMTRFTGIVGIRYECWKELLMET